jgi:hypothetical protein
MNLTNSWMNNPTFLAQSAHFFSAISAVMICAYFWGKPGAFSAAIAFFILAFFKEFWYDLEFELPIQTFTDSLLDFSFYLLGLVVAIIFVFLKK